MSAEFDLKKFIKKYSSVISISLFFLFIITLFFTGRNVVVYYRIQSNNQTCQSFLTEINDYVQNDSQSNLSCSNCYFELVDINDTELESLSQNFCTCDCTSGNSSAKVNIRLQR